MRMRLIAPAEMTLAEVVAAAAARGLRVVAGIGGLYLVRGR